MSLASLKGKDILPSVSEVIADAVSAEEGGQFTKVTTKAGKDYYYLTDSEALIDSKPDDFRVVKSVKHDAMFIVPNQSQGFSKF